MGTNIKLITVAAFIYATTVYSSCKKHILGCAESNYSFILNAKIFPDRDTVNINDTIWVEINSPDVFTDQISNQTVNFNDAYNLGTDMGFGKLINVSPVQKAYAVNDFNFVLLEGKEITSPNPELIKEFLFPDINGRYKFKLGVIPKSSGSYSFNLGNAVHVYRNGNSCPKADFQMQLIQTNQHYYLYPGGSGVTPAGSDYYFYVK
jgi:hypothetical protein